MREVRGLSAAGPLQCSGGAWMPLALSAALASFGLRRHRAWQPHTWIAAARSRRQACSAAGAQAPAGNMAAAPVLTFWERNPPFAALAAAKLSGASLDAKPDPKATKDTVATLTFASGWVVGCGEALRSAELRAPWTDPVARPPAAGSSLWASPLSCATLRVRGPMARCMRRTRCRPRRQVHGGPCCAAWATLAPALPAMQ